MCMYVVCVLCYSIGQVQRAHIDVLYEVFIVYVVCYICVVCYRVGVVYLPHNRLHSDLQQTRLLA